MLTNFWDRTLARWSAPLSFVVLGLVIYSNTLDAPFVFDDQSNIVRNPLIRLTRPAPGHIATIFLETLSSRRPLAYASFALNYSLHRYDVTGYHVVNMAIHVLAAIFLYLFLLETMKTPSVDGEYGRSSSLLAFLATLLWFVHPLHTQSVTYIVQRMNSMSAMFYVLSLLLYAKARLADGKRKRWLWFAGCLLAAVLALASKEIAATLPLVILLYEWFFFQDLRSANSRRVLLGLVAALIVFAAITLLFMGANPVAFLLSHYDQRDFTLTERVLTQPRVVVHYVTLLAYPHPSRLRLDYAFQLSRSLTDPPSTLLSMVAIAALVGLACYLARRRRLISFCIFWLLANLAIESSVLALEMVFEHRTYLPSMLFYLPILALGYRLLPRRNVVTGLACAVAVLFCVWTYQRNDVWRDRVSLWNDCVEKSAGKARPHNNLGLALIDEQRYGEAVPHLTEALRLKPDYPAAHNNLGYALAELGELEQAISHYSEALRLDSDFGEVHVNLGRALYMSGRLGEAIVRFRDAVRIQPFNEKAHNNLGSALAASGRLAEAEGYVSQALRLRPDYASAHNNMGTIFAMQGRLEEATAHFAEALRLAPDYAMASENLDRVRQQMGSYPKHKKKAPRKGP